MPSNAPPKTHPNTIKLIAMELMNISPTNSNPELLLSSASEREVSGRLIMRGPQETAVPRSDSHLPVLRVLQCKRELLTLTEWVPRGSRPRSRRRIPPRPADGPPSRKDPPRPADDRLRRKRPHSSEHSHTLTGHRNW